MEPCEIGEGGDTTGESVLCVDVASMVDWGNGIGVSVCYHPPTEAQPDPGRKFVKKISSPSRAISKELVITVPDRQFPQQRFIRTQMSAPIKTGIIVGESIVLRSCTALHN